MIRMQEKEFLADQKEYEKVGMKIAKLNQKAEISRARAQEKLEKHNAKISRKLNQMNEADRKEREKNLAKETATNH